MGRTDTNGEFRLTTFRIGDGAFPGQYKVTIRPAVDAVSAVNPHGSDGPPIAVPAVPRKSVILPERYGDPSKTVLTQEVPASGKVIFELQSTM